MSFVPHPNSRASLPGVASGLLVLNPADPFIPYTGSLQHLTGPVTPGFLNCTSLALLWLVFLLPLLFLSVSCAGFSICPVHHGVSQGSVLGSLEEPIHADGFKDSLPRNFELTSGPSIPPDLRNHCSAAFGCTDNSHGPEGTCSCPLKTCLFWVPAIAPRLLRSQTRNLLSSPAFSFCPSFCHLISKNC